MSFAYERLPNLCYWCGQLTHDDNDCVIWLRSKGSLSSRDQQYGAWLRAGQFNPSKKMVVAVQGYSQSKSQSKQRELVPMVEDSVKPARVVEAEISAHADFEAVIQGLDEEICGVKGNQNLSETVLRNDIATDGGEQLVKVKKNVAVTKVVHGG